MCYVDSVQIWVVYGSELCGDVEPSLEGSVHLKPGDLAAQGGGPRAMYDSSNEVHFLTSFQENSVEIDCFGQGRWCDRKNKKVYLLPVSGRSGTNTLVS